MNFNDTELQAISNATRVAAERFEEYAKEPALVAELQAQFALQAHQCRAIYDRIAEEVGHAS